MKDRDAGFEIQERAEVRNPNAGRKGRWWDFGGISLYRPLCSGPRISGLLRIWLFALAVQSSFAAATNGLDPNAIPPLRPPHAELPPSFWEQYGLWTILCGGVLLLALGAAVWLFMRPRPAVPVPPEETARRALEPLHHQPEDGALLSHVSQVLRRYIVAAFHLPPEELTTTEFCRLIASEGRLGRELASAVADFLRQCDQRKFSPPVPGPPLSAVAHSLKLIEQSQARLASLAAPAPPPSAPASRT